MAEQQQQLEPWTDLSGKVVMVTGASSGLGREFCLDLGKAGCRIVAAARRLDRLKSLCDDINRLKSLCDDINRLHFTGPQYSGLRAVAVELDISADGATVEGSVKAAWDAFGRIDALINNAGIRGKVRDPLELSSEEWDENMRTNLRGSWLVSKYVGAHMRDANQGGSIINISSIDGLNRGKVPGGLAYASSKAGLNTLTMTMALEVGMHRIRVNSISPGLFESEITKDLMKKEWLTNVVKKGVPLRTLGTVDPALTSLIKYLIHDSSEYITGNIFIVDSGATLPGVPIFSSL